MPPYFLFLVLENMNIDRELVNRALAKAGQEALKENDIQNNVLAWRTAKAFYLTTILETLSQTEWTGAKKREKLQIIANVENLNDLPYMYELPEDCAKPIALQNGEPFVVEGQFLYTAVADAVLLYVGNGRIADPAQYLDTEDYPEYRNIYMEPKFAQYIETRLASKIALKMTSDKSVYQLLYAEAVKIEDEARSASRSSGFSKPCGQKWWLEQV